MSALSPALCPCNGQVIRDTIIDSGGVLAFPNQSPDLTVADHIGFTRLFGSPEVHAVADGMPGESILAPHSPISLHKLPTRNF